MRQTFKTSLYFVGINACCLGLLFVFSNSGNSEEAKISNPRIKELQQKRLALLQTACEAAAKLFQNARIEYNAVLEAQRELLLARLESADERKDRILACDEMLKQVEGSIAFAESRFKAARGSQLAVLKFQALQLEIQIMREKLTDGE